MPDRSLQSFKCDTQKQKAYALCIIKGNKDLFITEVQISCPKANKNYFLNFHPIMRNINITNSKEMIEEV
jgi:hypothetical protein